MRLTKSEQLLVYRRREGLTQRAAAKVYAVPVGEYITWEQDGLPPGVKVPTIKLRPHERCFIMRRRANLTQAEVAKEMGFGRYWVRLMEQGKVACDDLLWFWEQ